MGEYNIRLYDLIGNVIKSSTNLIVNSYTSNENIQTIQNDTKSVITNLIANKGTILSELIQVSNMSIQITNSSSVSNGETYSINKGLSIVRLNSECVNILKSKYNISPKDELIYSKIDQANTNASNGTSYFSQGVTFYVYDSKGNVLDMSYCSSLKSEVLVPFRSTKMRLLSEYKNTSYMYNASDPFFNDVCRSYSSDGITDMPLNYRRSLMFLNVSITCNNNCIYSGISSDINYAVCQCNTDNIKGVSQSYSNIILPSLEVNNLNVLSCIEVFTSTLLIRNYGIWTMSGIFALSFIFSILFKLFHDPVIAMQKVRNKIMSEQAREIQSNVVIELPNTSKYQFETVDNSASDDDMTIEEQIKREIEKEKMILKIKKEEKDKINKYGKKKKENKLIKNYKDILYNYHIFLNLIFSNKCFIPLYLRILTFFLKLGLDFGCNSFLFSDYYIQQRYLLSDNKVSIF